MRLLDLFCGEWGVGRKFAERGHEVIGIDWNEPSEIPSGCKFVNRDILSMTTMDVIGYAPDFIWASSPCEEFSIHGMKMFYPKPKYPEMGIALFEHTRTICRMSGVPFVMENVRSAQQFVGRAVHHCGPFYLWGSAVPPLLNQGISKGYRMDKATTRLRSRRKGNPHNPHTVARNMATIPPELANCVADYAERLLEQKANAGPIPNS